MDLEEWEFLPVPANDRFLDFSDDDPKEFLKPPAGNSNQVAPVEVHLDPSFLVQETKQVITEAPNSEVRTTEEGDKDIVSKVFFKKMKENEFVDMKLDSPKSGDKGSSSAPAPQIDANLFHFDDKDVIMSSPRNNHKKDMVMSKNDKEKVTWEKDSTKLNIFKWGLTGIGAICSFGIAAATVCIIALGSNHKNKQQKLRFEIYTDDKRIKQVIHHATKLNEAISAVKGVPINRAHVSFGGYYECL